MMAVQDAGSLHTFDEILAWLAHEQIEHALTVEQIPLCDLDQWAFEGEHLRLAHRSGRFFAIEGVRVQTDAGPIGCWDQPIIHQPEIGILGIMTSVFDGVRHYLMQAKVEPGNINGAQVAPTVQATLSNYTRVHCGTATPFLESFIDPVTGSVLVDQLQGEQGSRFLRKRNRNMIVEVPAERAHKMPVRKGFCWMTLSQIRRLLTLDNAVNMDVRSVLACIPHQRVEAVNHAERTSFHTTDEIIHWLTALRSRHYLRLQPRALDQLEHWELDSMAIRHVSRNIFSVIGVEVESHTREVQHWTQPLLHHPGHGLNGFLMQRIHGVVHLLMRACIYPGNRELFELGSTVSRSNADLYFGRADAPLFLDCFWHPSPEQVRYAAVQSEEGGRFFHYQNRYMILEIPPDAAVQQSPFHRWMSLPQIHDFVRHGYVNIEGRNLLACLDLCEPANATEH